MEIKIPDANTPGFIRREKKRLAWVEAGEAFRADMNLKTQIDYFEAMNAWLAEYLDGSLEEAQDYLESLSETDLMAMSDKILQSIGENEPSPKA